MSVPNRRPVPSLSEEGSCQPLNRQLQAIARSVASPKNARASFVEVESPNEPKLGHCGRVEPLVDPLDVLAVLVSLLSLVIAIVIISPSLPHAARLQYTGQIIVIGLLLGIMNQAMQRVLPFLCLLIERRIGSSSLQNYDGLLKWTPIGSRESFTWRALITLTLLLPLALSVLYKRFTGGSSSQELPSIDGYIAPTVPPGLQNIIGLSIMANATTPFFAVTGEGSEPPDFQVDLSKAYGYNILLLSDMSAAAVDIPNKELLARLQNELHGDEAYYLGLHVRGTVASYNTTVESHRLDAAYWEPYTSVASVRTETNWNGEFFGMLNKDVATNDELSEWNNSWMFAGTFNTTGINESDPEAMNKAFQQTALAFDVPRHMCYVSLKATRASIEIVQGNCSAEPLPIQYQYYRNCELQMSWYFYLMIHNMLSPAGGDGLRYDLSARTAWLHPTYAVVIASAYQARIAMQNSMVHIQPGGYLYSYWGQRDRLHGYGLNETYHVSNITLRKTGPTLQPKASLYVTLAILPSLTVTSFILIPILRLLGSSKGADRSGRSILPRGFGLVAILAGLDRDSLAEEQTRLDPNVSLTGKTKRRITLDVDLSRSRSAAVEIENVWEDDYDQFELQPERRERSQVPKARYVLGADQSAPTIRGDGASMENSVRRPSNRA